MCPGCNVHETTDRNLVDMGARTELRDVETCQRYGVQRDLSEARSSSFRIVQVLACVQRDIVTPFHRRAKHSPMLSERCVQRLLEVSCVEFW